jgi:DNA replication protein DnaC
MRRCASNRRRSPTSPPCSKPNTKSAPSAANAAACSTRAFRCSSASTSSASQDNPNVPQATIAALAEGGWIDDREQVILIGDSETGKTHLAIALAAAACHAGRRVRFTTLAGLANELQEADSRRELARVVARYARIELLVVDELGYLALPEGAAELVFQVLSERHERGSLIVTTNLPFGEWTRVFPDARLAKAVVDRLTHRAHLIDTGTESWRFRHGLTKGAGRHARRGSAARSSD